MLRSFCIVSIFFFVLAPACVAQALPPKPALSKSDLSQEAFVVEQFSCKERFENDGTSSREVTARVHIQSEAGVQQYGLLSFSYASGTGTFEFGYIRVRKPDGTVVETPPENVQDMAAEITRTAPSYSDLHEKHVAVKSLSSGDVLEYHFTEHTTKPLVPGQFWTSYRFTREQIVLDEQLEISVPRERAVKLKSTSVQQETSEASGYRVYTWRSKNLEHAEETNKKRQEVEKLWQQARGRVPQPDILMSSFASWEDVGRWYGGLQDDRVKPSPEVAAKAAELTRNATTDEAKIRVLYDYVSTQFHYIGISFGIGRYQPHSAGVVLENQYGDCKDKHTLLASLLTAAGIPAYPALIGASALVDPDVPSPGQFDHVITVVPRGANLIWLDSTAEVGPYQYLLPPLRDKRALVVWKDKPALVSTPVNLPFDTVQKFNMEAKLSDTGTLEGHADFSTRGDLEYFLRAGFRSVPVPQWKELAQRISLSLGFGGDVSEVTASSPEKTDEPFRLSYKYTRKEFGDWSNHRILSPCPSITMPPRDEELLPLGPTWLGPLMDVQFESQVELPAGYRPVLPEAIHWKRDFAQFDATYSFKDGKLIGQRLFKTLMPEAPAAEREQYKQLVKIVEDDYGQYIPLSSGLGSSESTAQSKGPYSPGFNVLGNLLDSSNEAAAKLETEARDEMTRGDFQGAVSSLYRAVSADPKFTRAWVILGGLLLMQKQFDAGTEAFHKAMAADPAQPGIPKALGLGLMAATRFEDAIGVWQDFIKAHPDDVDGPSYLGASLNGLQRYAEAAEAYEAAVKLAGVKPYVRMSLGKAYLRAGNRDKAAAAFRGLAEADKEGDYFNDVAYEMANVDMELPLALDYARKAVRKVEEKSQAISLPDLRTENLRLIFPIASYWDTLGWVHERMSNLDAAEQYLRSAWRLTQDGVVAGHLCHLYRRVHRNADAIQMCRLALFRIPLSGGLEFSESQTEINAAKENLAHLTGRAAKEQDSGDAVDVVIRERTFKLPRFLPGTESAEFFVLLASDGKNKPFKVEDVKFISGSDKMKMQGKVLKNIDFKVSAPDDGPTRFVRRGILGCYQYSGCSFVLLDPATVHSLN